MAVAGAYLERRERSAALGAHSQRRLPVLFFKTLCTTMPIAFFANPHMGSSYP